MRPAALALILLLSLPLVAQPRFISVDVPGAIETQVRGINNSGEIVGFYRLASDACIPYSSSGGVQIPSCDVHGFKVVNGVLTTINVPGSLSTAVTGVNDRGDLVGYFTKTSDECIVEQHAFLWTRQNVIWTFDYPEWTGFCGTDALWTVPRGINDAGTVVGTIGSPLDGLPSGGFVYKNGQVTPVNPSGGDAGCPNCTGANGINNRGVIVGSAWRIFGVIPMWVGYVKKGADYDFFARSQDDTWATAINDRGDVAGYGIYGAGFVVTRGELGKAGPNAIPDLTGVGYPDAVGTYPLGLNNRRVIVGTYMSVDGALHGFVATGVF